MATYSLESLHTLVKQRPHTACCEVEQPGTRQSQKQVRAGLNQSEVVRYFTFLATKLVGSATKVQIVDLGVYTRNKYGAWLMQAQAIVNLFGGSAIYVGVSNDVTPGPGRPRSRTPHTNATADSSAARKNQFPLFCEALLDQKLRSLEHELRSLSDVVRTQKPLTSYPGKLQSKAPPPPP